jgi:16S rRNA (guanine527-N7)-methyltransferase
VKHIEAEPESAKSIFGSGIETARAYVKALARDSDLLGLLGPRELDRIWSRHVLNSAVVAELIQPGSKVADVGSGAGLPGIPMAIVRPSANFVLIEPMERRFNWLLETIDELGIKNVKVLNQRGEDVSEHDFDVVTARALSGLEKLLRICVPLLRPGGAVLALKGFKAAEEIETAKRLQKKLRIESFEIVVCGQDVLPEPTSVVITKLV